MTNRLTGSDPKYKQTFDTLLSHADRSYKEVEESLVREGKKILSDDEDSNEALPPIEKLD